jgi:hypothetical protein
MCSLIDEGEHVFGNAFDDARFGALRGEHDRKYDGYSDVLLILSIQGCSL